MLDELEKAFSKGRLGFSIWSIDGGGYQASIKQGRGGFAIAQGEDPQSAFSSALRMADGHKAKVTRRNDEDLL